MQSRKKVEEFLRRHKIVEKERGRERISKPGIGIYTNPERVYPRKKIEVRTK